MCCLSMEGECSLVFVSFVGFVNLSVVLLKKIGFWGDESSMWERDRGSNRKVMEMNDNGAVALSQRNDKIIEKNE